MNVFHLEVSADDGATSAAIAAAVAEALASGQERPRLSVTLTGSALPAPVVGALVSGLRKVRERGGAIAVQPATPALQAAFSLHGLDRVFAFPLGDDPTVRRNRGAGFNVGRFAAALVGMLALVTSGFPARAEAPAEHDPATIVARLTERNPNLSSYQGRMHVDIKMVSFPYLHEHLDATTYYKRPSNYEVKFDRVPFYAHGFEKIYTDIGDPSAWEKRFVVTYVGETPYDNHRDIELRLDLRVRGQIDHETVLVDPSEWTIDQIRYDYYNGGHITMSQQFRPTAGYMLLAAQTAEIAIPHVRATAHGTYDGYRTNVALDDSVFSANKN